METNQISRLRLMRDYGPSDVEANRRISDAISSVLAHRGFVPLDTPALERTELFVRKSGGEIAGSLYSFTDPSGISVSLRPEFTPSIIRWFVENVGDTAGVHRFQYSGPVFRYAGGPGASYRQFEQCGGEKLGASGADSDADILMTAERCLATAGIERPSVRVGHIGIVRELVQSLELSDALQMFVLSNLDEITAGKRGADRLTEQAAAAGLIYSTENGHVNAPASAGDEVPALEALGDSLAGPMGRRSRERIMARLVSRMRRAAPESEFRHALSKVSELVRSRGEPSEALDSMARAMESSGASTRSVEALGAALGELSRHAGESVSIRLDPSFARGMAYYTGIVFEFACRSDGEEIGLGGGGRYDDLVRAFGGVDTPACGFALNVDAIISMSRVGSSCGTNGAAP